MLLTPPGQLRRGSDMLPQGKKFCCPTCGRVISPSDGRNHCYWVRDGRVKVICPQTTSKGVTR